MVSYPGAPVTECSYWSISGEGITSTLIMVMIMVMKLYSAFLMGVFKCALQASEIGHQHIQGPLAAAISPLVISTST